MFYTSASGKSLSPWEFCFHFKCCSTCEIPFHHLSLRPSKSLDSLKAIVLRFLLQLWAFFSAMSFATGTFVFPQFGSVLVIFSLLGTPFDLGYIKYMTWFQFLFLPSITNLVSNINKLFGIHSNCSSTCCNFLLMSGALCPITVI
jgi:predicted membrane protein